MSRLMFLFAIGGLALTQLAACSTSQTMSPAQREGVEMRRFCEQNPRDTARCAGFLGFV